MKLLNVEPEVSLAAAGGRAKLALEDGLVAGVDQPEEGQCVMKTRHFKRTADNWEPSPLQGGNVVLIFDA